MPQSRNGKNSRKTGIPPRARTRTQGRKRRPDGKNPPERTDSRNRRIQEAAPPEALRERIREWLITFDIEKLRRQAEQMSRRFVLHIGPTNSGKTYQAIRALEQASSGVYLGPLRLLALEMYDRLNRNGTPCSLLTGE